jgi:tryptophan 2,3-dioxygenase
MSKVSKYSSIHYNSYLQLDKILSAQDTKSQIVFGKSAHEETLFIIVHQVYELWFKQINHELYSIHDMFNQHMVDERNLGVIVGRLDRVTTIMDLIVEQIKVMETMTPLDFLEFRSLLFPASGFQSFQFRELEVLLGLKKDKRHTYNNMPYQDVFNDERKQKLKALEEGPSLRDLLEDWLERTPFIDLDGFNFVEAYKAAVAKMVESEQNAIKNTDVLTDKYKEMRIKMVGDMSTYFASIWDPNHHAKLIEEGKASISYEAMVAALFINLYRDEPILQLPFQLLRKVVEIDEGLAMWRYRHAQMVMKMLGNKMGTGGSSGHEYLNKTAQKHHIFSDLHSISTLLIPRNYMPKLPPTVKENLGFHYKPKL